jgi:hypothetical protein
VGDKKKALHPDKAPPVMTIHIASFPITGIAAVSSDNVGPSVRKDTGCVPYPLSEGFRQRSFGVLSLYSRGAILTLMGRFNQDELLSYPTLSLLLMQRGTSVSFPLISIEGPHFFTLLRKAQEYLLERRITEQAGDKGKKVVK